MPFHIVYPGGDKTKLTLVEITVGLEYELSDYAVASRNSFCDDDVQGAINYCKMLALKHNLSYDVENVDDGNTYLD